MYMYRAGYRSEAVYIRSEDAHLSHGIGRVQSLALSAAFGKALHWPLLAEIQKMKSQSPVEFRKTLSYRPCYS